MQKEVTALKDDLRYFVQDASGAQYRAYPSLKEPRFIFPARDRAARAFLSRILAADFATAGALGKFAAPLAPLALRYAPRCFTGAAHPELRSFIETLGFPATAQVSKLCQHLVAEDTKVLFLITDGALPLAIIKVMRDASFDAKLRNEKEAQARAGSVAPNVLQEGTLFGRYAYAEEALDGAPITRAEALEREDEIVRLIATFPIDSAVSSRKVADALMPLAPAESVHLPPLLATLSENDVSLPLGLAHGDLGAPNIIATIGGLQIIDWEHAGERPFHLLDAVHFMMRLRRISNQREWRENGQGALVRITGVAKEEADALYALLMVYRTFERKFPALYPAMVAQVKAIL